MVRYFVKLLSLQKQCLGCCWCCCNQISNNLPFLQDDGTYKKGEYGNEYHSSYTVTFCIRTLANHYFDYYCFCCASHGDFVHKYEMQLQKESCLAPFQSSEFLAFCARNRMSAR
jgi:hypothetical protein